MRDYTGKTIYVGLDVHKKTYAVTAICEQEVVKKDTLVANPMTLIDYLKKYFKGAKITSAYEAGFCGYSLHRHLVAQGIDNRVVHPAGIEIASNNSVKTDKRDSLKIAIQLSVGRLQGIHVPTPQRENYRSISRLRETLIKHRHRVGCQLKSLLFQQGLIQAEDDTCLSEKRA